MTDERDESPLDWPEDDSPPPGDGMPKGVGLPGQGLGGGAVEPGGWGAAGSGADTFSENRSDEDEDNER